MRVGYRNDRIIGARHDQRLLPHRRQREQAGPHRACKKLVQVADLRSSMQLLQKQSRNIFAVSADGTAVELTGDRPGIVWI